MTKPLIRTGTIPVYLIVILSLCMLNQGCLEAPKKGTFNRTETTSDFNVQYDWNYRGYKWMYESIIPKSSYEYFKSKQRIANYGEYVLNPIDDTEMNHLADMFNQKAKEQRWDEAEALTLVLSFVQSMPSTSDKVTTGYDEYPRYPVETIVDGGGDCEDTSILFASIVRAMGYGVVLLDYIEGHHMAVGVLISPELVNNWKQNYALTYYTAPDGRIYAYCETTGTGWELGHKPEQFISQTARIIDVSGSGYGN